MWPPWSTVPSNCGHNSTSLELKAMRGMQLARIYSQELFQLSADLTSILSVLNLSSNLKCFCNKVSGRLSYVLCCSICLKRKWKSQSTWTVSWIRQYHVSPQFYTVERERELGLQFHSGACLLQQSESSKTQRAFLISNFSLGMVFPCLSRW